VLTDKLAIPNEDDIKKALNELIVMFKK